MIIANSIIDWFQTSQTIVMALASLFVWVVLRGFQLGKWSTTVDRSADFDALRESIRAIHRRLDDAGEKASDLASAVQGMPERIRRDFITRDEFTIMTENGREDRMRLWQEIARLWDTFRQHRGGKQ